MGLQSFIYKVKQKQAQNKILSGEKKAQKLGFKNFADMNKAEMMARESTIKSHKAKKRKKHLAEIKATTREEMQGGMNKYQRKFVKGKKSFDKGLKVYNEMMGELRGLSNSSEGMFPKGNSKQSYASGYGIYGNKPKKKRKAKKKEKKTKRRSKPKQNNFWVQFQ